MTFNNYSFRLKVKNRFFSEETKKKKKKVEKQFEV